MENDDEAQPPLEQGSIGSATVSPAPVIRESGTGTGPEPPAPAAPERTPARGPKPSRLFRWGYPLLGVLLFALYAPTVAPGPTFSDGPEIVTGIVTLGVIHPTGYPLFTLVAHAFVKLLPIDVQPCVKVSLFNALCAAAAAVFTAHVARSVALLVRPAEDGRGRPGADVAGLFSGLLLGTCPLVWDQVRIPEVYPFHLFLTAWALYSIVRFEVTRRAGFLVMAALAIGLGLAHHVTMVYMLPAGVVYTLVREPSLIYGPFAWPVVKTGRLFKKGLWPGAKVDRAWVFPAVLVVGAAPAAFYLYLIWANRHTTGINWGGVNDWNGLYFHMTGKQYSRFMQWKDLGHYLTRLGRMAEAFDKQFLTVGTALALPGLVAAFRRAWRAALLLLLVFLFFVLHGVYYSVGDYQTYWLPAMMAAAVFLGVGLDAVLRWAHGRAAGERLFATLCAAALISTATAISILAYAAVPRRLPAPVAKLARNVLVWPFAGLAVASAALAFVARRRAARGLPPRLRLPGRATPGLTPGEKVFPGLLLASAVLPTVPAVVVRVMDIRGRQVVGDSYGREIMENAPPGSVILVQGDGYLFTLWYQAHVMGRGTDSAIIDVPTAGAQWYKKYLTSHYPAPCDPRLPQFLQDRAAYEAKCETFRQRMDLGAAQAWITMGERRTKLLTPNERKNGVAMLTGSLAEASGRLPRLPRTDVRCDDAGFRRKHGKECRCWWDPKRDPVYGEECVFSADEGGVVPRERVEQWLHRIVEEHIDDRPVFERNLFTHWVNNIKENPRGWAGPDYQRISGEYALLNRGRANQILYASEVEGEHADACGEVRRMLDAPRPRGPRLKEGRPYRPNPWPTLITASFLTRVPLEGDDNASRSYHPGEEIRLWVDWFEKHRYDHHARDKRGAPIRHGVRACIFDGSGRRAGMKTVITPRRDAITFKLPAGAPEGDYHIAACTVGDVGDSPKVLDGEPCRRLILEYPFKVTARKE